MACNNGGLGRMNRKKIMVLSSVGAGIAAASYAALTLNPLAGVAAPLILAFVACPAMCATMGGVMWIRERMAKKKASSMAMAAEQTSKEHGCCGADKQPSKEATENKQEVLMTTQETKVFENNNEVDDGDTVELETRPQLQQQQRKKKIQQIK